MSNTLNKSRINRDFESIKKKLMALGFKESPATKTRIYTLTFQSTTAKGYISIRYHPDKNASTVLAEFFGKTTTQETGIGGGMRLIEITPKQNNHDEYKGMDSKSCQSMFTDIGTLMIQAHAIFKEMESF